MVKNSTLIHKQFMTTNTQSLSVADTEIFRAEIFIPQIKKSDTPKKV
jgi:hypothetical protein